MTMTHLHIRDSWRSAPRSFQMFAGRAIFLLIFIALDIVVFPPLFSLQAIPCCLGFLLLVSRKRELFRQFDELPKLSIARITLFLSIHAALLATAIKFMPLGDGSDSSLRGFIAPALRMLVFLPGLVLLPLVYWSRLVQVFPGEVFAALLVLFTFFPYRIGLFLWDHFFANALAAGVYACLAPFFRDAFFVAGKTPEVGTLRFSASLLYGCSGINEIFLFQELFGLMVIMDWKRLIPRRTVAVYFSGLLLTLVGNLLRVVSILTAGTISTQPAAADGLHSIGGGIFSIVTFVSLVALSYPWISNYQAREGIHTGSADSSLVSKKRACLTQPGRSY